MERPLTRREQELLAALAAREEVVDPAFARRLRDLPGRRPRRAGLAWLLVGVLAVVGVTLLVVPGVFVLAAVATAVLLVVPVALIAWAMHQGDPPSRM
ncbi:DUF3040 family protein [Actinomycetospora succinea]|uniref:DUF3040 family protein n=1 Tax=Actinomycetospora succinea TaxID=663603 RepID=A0A4R6UZI0_9PSEU|nr:DUF3040 domain-containing protein [Actinomycetospora succinea]TDQ52785.1 DUF3040 family protein [Actinomycetospora succinea]